MGGTGFWRADVPGQRAGDYGPLNAIARNKVNLDRIVTHWPDMLRVAGSLITNQVRAYDLLRMLTRDGYPTPLGQALAEYGRIPKTPAPARDGRPGRRDVPAHRDPAVEHR